MRRGGDRALDLHPRLDAVEGRPDRANDLGHVHPGLDPPVAVGIGQGRRGLPKPGEERVEGRARVAAGDVVPTRRRGGAIGERGIERGREAASALLPEVEDRRRGVDRAVEHERAHVIRVEARVRLRESRPVALAVDREAIHAEDGTDGLDVLGGLRRREVREAVLRRAELGQAGRRERGAGPRFAGPNRRVPVAHGVRAVQTARRPDPALVEEHDVVVVADRRVQLRDERVGLGEPADTRTAGHHDQRPVARAASPNHLVDDRQGPSVAGMEVIERHDHLAAVDARQAGTVHMLMERRDREADRCVGDEAEQADDRDRAQAPPSSRDRPGKGRGPIGQRVVDAIQQPDRKARPDDCRAAGHDGRDEAGDDARLAGQVGDRQPCRAGEEHDEPREGRDALDRPDPSRGLVDQGAQDGRWRPDRRIGQARDRRRAAQVAPGQGSGGEERHRARDPRSGAGLAERGQATGVEHRLFGLGRDGDHRGAREPGDGKRQSGGASRRPDQPH